jgi:type VI secretion system protein ImpH
MAAGDRTTPDALIRELTDGAHRYGFFQAVRLLECLLSKERGVGKSEHPREDPVRFCQDTSLAFAPTTIDRYVPAGTDHAARLFVNFMGLLGPNGALPLTVSGYLHDRVHNHNDTAMVRFLDIFNHRMISLFYRGWAAGQQVLSRDRPDDDTYDRFVGSLFGLGMRSFLGADVVPDEAKRHFAGRLASQAKNPEGLEGIVSGYFGIPTKIVEFVGRWMPLVDEYRCRLGTPRGSQALGSTAIVGGRVWECQQKFRLRLGPMALADYERLLPRTDSFRRLVDWVHYYIGHELVWDVVLILKAKEVPRTRLGSYGRLGWTTWLAKEQFDDDVGDLLIDEESVETMCRGNDRGRKNGRD